MKRLEHEGAGAITPWPPEVPFDLAVAGNLETTLGESRTSDVADQGLEAISIRRVGARGPMQGEAIGVGGECGRIWNRMGTRTEVHRRVAQARDPAAGIGAEGDAVLYGHSLKEREE